MCVCTVCRSVQPGAVTLVFCGHSMHLSYMHPCSEVREPISLHRAVCMFVCIVYQMKMFVHLSKKRVLDANRFAEQAKTHHMHTGTFFL